MSGSRKMRGDYTIINIPPSFLLYNESINHSIVGIVYSIRELLLIHRLVAHKGAQSKEDVTALSHPVCMYTQQHVHSMHGS